MSRREIHLGRMLGGMAEIVSPSVTVEQVQAARLAVCAGAHDAEDAALILEALGIGER